MTASVVQPANGLRWRPSRAGLVALWRYWDETFTFHRGRLLLRGPNGAGKSMAMELLLPFLLDADASPHRLSSAARSRGGLYERIMTGSGESSRVGFAWVEFVRGTDVFTIGVRLRTSAATRSVDPAYFTTTQRVGSDLHLLGPDRSPLSRVDLERAVQPYGEVHPTGEAHRDAVRAVLYPGFTGEDYASVVSALLALRKEKLSQDLDLAKLSTVLSDSLAPLDEHDLAPVAEGFERLDRRQADLERLQEEVREVRLLRLRQRDYARAVLRTLAADVRAADTRRGDVTRAERDAEAALDRARERAAGLSRESTGLDERLESIGVERDALRDRDAYREGRGLDDLRNEIRRLGEAVLAAERTVARADDAVATAEASVERTGRQADEATANARRARGELDAAVARVGAEAATAGADVAGGVGPAEDGSSAAASAEQVRSLLTAWTAQRRALVGEVRTALVAHQTAVQTRDFVREELEREQQTLDARTTAATEARRALAAATTAHVTEVQTWVRGLRSIDPARVRAALPAPPEVPAEVAAAVSVLGTDLAAEQAVDLAAAQGRRTLLSAERAAILQERDACAAGELVEPPAPPWRADRTGRAGAPLWRLVEVRDTVRPEQVDGLEAALTGAGLLDAWLHPDGRIDLEGHPDDVSLGARPVAGRTLADLLGPLAHPEVSESVVAAVLASVPVRSTAGHAAGADGARPETGLVVGTDGTFRVGPAHGHGPTGQALLLGAEARERRRLLRLAELDDLLATLGRRLDTADRELATLDRDRRAVAAELAALPDGRAVRDRVVALGAADSRVAEAAERTHGCRTRLDYSEQATRESLRHLTTAGAMHGLPTDAYGLRLVEEALLTLEQTAEAWTHRSREAGRAVERDAEARRWLATTSSSAEAATNDLEAARRDHRAVRGRLSTLESTVGAEFREIVGTLDRLQTERAALERRRPVLGREIRETDKETGSLEARLAQVGRERTAADEHRERVSSRLVAAVGDGLHSDAGVEVGDHLVGVTAVLTASRALSSELGDAPDGREVERTSSVLADRLHRTQELVGGRTDLDRRLSEHGWWAMSALVAGLRRSVTDLVGALEHELHEGRQELADEERRIFEGVLAGSVRRALADRIRLANRLVDDINTHLDRVRTSAGGVAVRLRWDVDPTQPDAVRSARELLLRDPVDLSEAQGEALQAFVRARVEQARAELEPSAPWEARLRETLDYRSWHRFTLQIAHRDWSGYEPATNARLQRLSTGERSIALHLPMIASLAAHYAGRDGRPAECPRLVLLDELFVGVDPANRSQLFGTFTTWDLDAFFTSDHEWCQYASLDGIAIHHLHPPAKDEPATSTRFTWDGRRRVVAPEP